MGGVQEGLRSALYQSGLKVGTSRCTPKTTAKAPASARSLGLQNGGREGGREVSAGGGAAGWQAAVNGVAARLDRAFVLPSSLLVLNSGEYLGRGWLSAARSPALCRSRTLASWIRSGMAARACGWLGDRFWAACLWVVAWEWRRRLAPAGGRPPPKHCACSIATVQLHISDQGTA